MSSRRYSTSRYEYTGLRIKVSGTIHNFLTSSVHTFLFSGFDLTLEYPEYFAEGDTTSPDHEFLKKEYQGKLENLNFVNDDININVSFFNLTDLYCIEKNLSP